MALDLTRALQTYTPDRLAALARTPQGRAELQALQAQLAPLIRQDAQRNALLYYQVANPKAVQVHLATAREFGIQGGRKSGKTGGLLAEAAIQMTGLVPWSLRVCAGCGAPVERGSAGWEHRDATRLRATEPPDGHPAVLRYPAQKLRPPIRVRLVVTSNVNAWDENLKQKLQYFQWNGRLNADGLPGDPRYGHWGFIPQRFLLDGDWEQSWSERHRKLTLCRHGDGGTEPGSTLTVMSHNQALEDFHQGSYHLILEDEIPPEEVHRANTLRVLEVRGQILTGGTPPDDRPGAVTTGWFFDRVLQPGLAGVDPAHVQAVALWTEDNRTLDPEEVQEVSRGLTAEERRTIFHGESLHLADLILPGFTETPRHWCFACGTAGPLGLGHCPGCGGTDLAPYCHVWDDEDLAWPGPATWPIVFYLDPHQARPTACAWVRVDPLDQWWVVAELEVEGDAPEVRQAVESLEAQHGWHPVWRKGDPKLPYQSNQFTKTAAGQPFSIKRAFDEAGLPFLDATPDFALGRTRLQEALKPNPYTRQPRLRVHRTCARTRYQVTHFVWQGTRTSAPDILEKPSRKHSDFPALLRYCANDDPTWAMLDRQRHPRPVIVGAEGRGRNARTGW